MATHTQFRVDVARRLAASLGVEPTPELVELVPPVDWDELITRAELRDELGRHHEQVDRRLTAIRDALAAARHDDLRRVIAWHVVTLAAVTTLALWAGRIGRRSSEGASRCGS